MAMAMAVANPTEACRNPHHHHHHPHHHHYRSSMDGPPNGFPHLPSLDRPDASNCDSGRPRGHTFHGDVASGRLPWLCPLPSKRRLLIALSVVVLLMLAFLVFSAVDLGAETDRTQAESILDGPWSGRSTAFSKVSYMHDRYNNGDHDRDPIHHRAQLSRPEDQRLPLQLTSPRYRPFWAQFRSSLYLWVQRKRYDPQIMTQLLSSVKGPVDHHYMKFNRTAASGKPYSTCAVVGNSGILLNQEHGSLIDGHDMVMRLNNARIAGFEKHVGSKTTLSFINSNIFHSCARRIGCSCHPYGADVPLIMYICQVVHLMDVETCSSSLHAPIIVTDPRFDTLCARIIKYYSLKRFVEMIGRRLEDWSNAHEGPLFHYSSGMQAILLAVGICEKVSIFGFGKSEKSKHHYHTGQREELHLHDYGAEYDFYMDLASQNAEIIPFLNEAGFSLPPVHIYW